MSAAAHAQEGGPNPQVNETVVVIGQTIEETLPQELEKFGSDLEVIDSEELREKTYIDASSAMQMEIPGLHITPRGGPFSYMDVSFQGSRSQDMLFLVDGVRINNRLYNTTLTDTLPSSMIERIEVLKGGQSLFYGTQAAAGVINVVTRGYTDELDGQVRVGVDTNQGYHADAYVRGQGGPGNFVAYLSQDKAEGFDTYTNVQPSVTDLDRSYDVTTVGGKYRIDFSDNLAVDARYHHTDAALDYAGVSRTAFSQNVRDEDIASLALDYAPSDMLQFLVKGYWHDWDSEYTTINNVVGSPGQQEVVDLNTYWGFEDKGVNALAKVTPGGPLEYVVGYDFQQYSGRDDVLLIENQEEDVHAVFAQFRTSDDFIQNGNFAAGVRYNETGGVSQTVWNASGRYDFTDYIYAQGNIGTSFLLPTAYNLYGIDDCCTLGNPDLEAEEGRSYNFSIGGQYGSHVVFGWQVTYFNRKIDNFIGSVATTDAASLQALGIDPSQPFRGRNVLDFGRIAANASGEVNVDGFELLGNADFGNGFSADVSYTQSETQQESNGGPAVDVQRIPSEYAKAGVAYRPGSGRWGASANALWTGEQISSVTGFGDVNYGDYVVIDLAAHYFLDAEQTHKLTVRLENALDEDYITRPGSSETDASRLARAADPTLAVQRFYFGNRGVPQTLHLTYSYDF